MSFTHRFGYAEEVDFDHCNCCDEELDGSRAWVECDAEDCSKAICQDHWPDDPEAPVYCLDCQEKQEAA